MCATITLFPSQSNPPSALFIIWLFFVVAIKFYFMLLFDCLLAVVRSASSFTFTWRGLDCCFLFLQISEQPYLDLLWFDGWVSYFPIIICCIRRWISRWIFELTIHIQTPLLFGYDFSLLVRLWLSMWTVLIEVVSARRITAQRWTSSMQQFFITCLSLSVWKVITHETAEGDSRFRALNCNLR